MGNLKIVWTTQARLDLKNIYEYWEKKSRQGAIHVRSAILESPKLIFYAEQYQIDDINPKYRRIIVRDYYKVLYRAENDLILVVGIVGTLQSPDAIAAK